MIKAFSLSKISYDYHTWNQQRAYLYGHAAVTQIFVNVLGISWWVVLVSRLLTASASISAVDVVTVNGTAWNFLLWAIRGLKTGSCPG
jgi:hypothetical protein